MKQVLRLILFTYVIEVRPMVHFLKQSVLQHQEFMQQFVFVKPIDLYNQDDQFHEDLQLDLDFDGDTGEQDFSDSKESSKNTTKFSKVDLPRLNIHLVPFSRILVENDLTIPEMLSETLQKSDSRKFATNLKDIFETSIAALMQDKRRTFSIVDDVVAFYEYYKKLSQQRQIQVIDLISNNQLEIIGWSAHDQVSDNSLQPSFNSWVFNQSDVSQSQLNNTKKVSFLQIQTDSNGPNKLLIQNSTLNLNSGANGYCWPQGFQVDKNYRDQKQYSQDEQFDMFVQHLSKIKTNETDQVFLPFGCDYAFEDASMNYEAMDKMLDDWEMWSNQKGYNITMQYSSPQQFYNKLDKPKLPAKTITSQLVQFQQDTQSLAKKMLSNTSKKLRKKVLKYYNQLAKSSKL